MECSEDDAESLLGCDGGGGDDDAMTTMMVMVLMMTRSKGDERERGTRERDRARAASRHQPARPPR
jgi:hypothetical protein